jgi:hypothetical protein
LGFIGGKKSFQNDHWLYTLAHSAGWWDVIRGQIKKQGKLGKGLLNKSPVMVLIISDCSSN